MVDSSNSLSNAPNAHRLSNLPTVPNDDGDEPPCSGTTPVPHIAPVITGKAPSDKDPMSTSSDPAQLIPPGRSATVSSTALTVAPPFVDKEKVNTDIAPANRLRVLFTPTHELGPSPGYLVSARNALFHSPLNILLLFIPVSWALHWTHQSDTVIFVVSALAIAPLAALLGLGTEQIALRTSQAVGGLLNATLGNVVELIIAGIALGKCDLDLVQGSLLGGLLSNLLLVLGMAFIGALSTLVLRMLCAPPFTDSASLRSGWIQVPVSGVSAHGSPIELFLDDGLRHRLDHPCSICKHRPQILLRPPFPGDLTFRLA